MAPGSTPSHVSAVPGPLGRGDVGQIALRARDLDAMVAFYRDVLGLKFLFRAPPGLAFFAAGSLRLLLTADPEAPAGGNSTLYFRVADLPAVHAALRERGAVVAGEPHRIAQLPDHDLWMSFVRDPEANLIGLMSEVRPPADRSRDLSGAS